MKQVTTTVYTFGELLAAANDPNNEEVSQRAVDRAREWFGEMLNGYDWYDITIEEYTTALEQVGFPSAEIAFSGFWSQGDGASFKSDLDFAALIEFFTKRITPEDCIRDGEPGGWLPYIVKKVGQRINARYEWLELALNHLDGKVERTSHQYSHENTCRASLRLTHPRCMDEVDALVVEFEEDVEDLRKDLCRIIYRALEEEYEHRTSDECLIEDSDANEYTFDAAGRRYG